MQQGNYEEQILYTSQLYVSNVLDKYKKNFDDTTTATAIAIVTAAAKS